MPKPRKKSGSRSIEKRLFIVCEGSKDKSESAYFKSLIKCCHFAGDKVEVRVIDTRKNTGRELVKMAKKIKEFPFDEAWVVYDRDGYTLHAETFSLAKDNKINIAFSAISFEIWILLHFEFTTHVFQKSDEVIKYIKSKNYMNYEKSRTDVYSELKNKLKNAIKNAKKMQNHQIDGNPHGTPIYNMNPYTNIDQLINAIYELQEDE
ncbi:MAG: RloB domain-containing protein [Spirochaetales bacterium]|nr:RloB domain-containing protein [Spirochaetales bacterium]